MQIRIDLYVQNERNFFGLLLLFCQSPRFGFLFVAHLVMLFIWLAFFDLQNPKSISILVVNDSMIWAGFSMISIYNACLTRFLALLSNADSVYNRFECAPVRPFTIIERFGGKVLKAHTIISNESFFQLYQREILLTIISVKSMLWAVQQAIYKYSDRERGREEWESFTKDREIARIHQNNVAWVLFVAL